MKTMKLNKKEISIICDNHSEASRVYDRVVSTDHEREVCSIVDNVFVYSLKNSKHIFIVVEQLFKLFVDGNYSVTLVDKVVDGDYVVLDIFESVAKDDDLFRVSLVNDAGTVGRIGFGCWQFGRILTLKEYVGGFSVILRNSNLDECIHCLEFGDGFSIVIDLCSVSF